MQYLRHTYTNNSFMIYLKFKCTWCHAVYLANFTWVGESMHSMTFSGILWNRLCMCVYMHFSVAWAQSFHEVLKKVPNPKQTQNHDAAMGWVTQFYPLLRVGKSMCKYHPWNQVPPALKWISDEKLLGLIIEKNCYFIFKNILSPAALHPCHQGATIQGKLKSHVC